MFLSRIIRSYCIRHNISSIVTSVNIAIPAGRQSIHTTVLNKSVNGSSIDSPPFSGEIPIEQVELKYSRSGGPGGQHANKVATKVEVRFNVEKANWIPDWIKPNLLEKEKNRVNKEGYLIITSDKTRKQILNQADCLNRLREMIYDASKKPKEPSPEEIALKEKRKARRSALILKQKRYDSLTKSSRGSQGLA